MKATSTARRRDAVSAQGLAAGNAVADQAASLLLTAYNNRKPAREAHPASDALSAIMEELRSALGVVASDPKVADALHRLDGAVWDCAVEHEDRAWYAAWAAAMALKGGR